MFEVTERDELLGLISDMHKDVYGFRPRHDMSGCTIADLRQEVADLQARIDVLVVEDRERQAQAILDFESRVDQIIATGAGDRETAVRWLLDGCDFPGDSDFLEYQYDLPYGYIQRTALN